MKWENKEMGTVGDVVDFLLTFDRTLPIVITTHDEYTVPLNCQQFIISDLWSAKSAKRVNHLVIDPGFWGDWQ